MLLVLLPIRFVSSESTRQCSTCVLRPVFGENIPLRERLNVTPDRSHGSSFRESGSAVIGALPTMHE